MKILLLTTSVLLSSLTFADTITGKREVLLDNDAVEVIRLTYPPGSESGMHSHKHPHRVVYVIAGGQLEMIPVESDEPAQVVTAKAGMTMFVPANTHNVRNIGNTEIILLETELKHRD